MRFEKLNENKIRITLSSEDLSKEQIDFHSFMSNSIESQDLFFNMLDKAEKEIGFITKNYQIRIEAFAIASGDFIITVTRSLPNGESKFSDSFSHFCSKSVHSDSFLHFTDSSNKSILSPSKPRRKLKIKRKNTAPTSTNAFYRFECFDDFYLFCLFLQEHNLHSVKFARSIILYEYNNTYYLSFENISIDCPVLKILFSSITEFATFINRSDLFANKLHECGKVIMKNNAIRTCLKYFS